MAENTVFDQLNSVSVLHKSPWKRARVTFQCLDSFALPFTVARFALLENRDNFQCWCEWLTVKNQCFLEKAAAMKERREHMVKLEKTGAAARTTSKRCRKTRDCCQLTRSCT